MQLIGKNIFSLGLSRVVSGLVLFFVYVRLVTYLGPDDFGRFSLVLAFYTMFLLFIDLGMSRYVIKKVSEDPSKTSGYLGNFLVLQLLLSGLIFLVFIGLPYLLEYDQIVTKSMFIAGLGLFFASVALPFAAILQAVQKIYLVALVYFIHTILTALWFVFSVYSDKGLVFLFYAYIVVGLIDLLIYLWVSRKFAKLSFSFDRETIKSMIIFGLPFALISGFEILIQKIDVVIQKVFLPFAEVGLYSSAYRFLDFLTFLPAVVAISLFPYFSSKQNLNDSDSLETINNLNRFMWTLALPLGVFGSILGRQIIFSLFDERYAGAVMPFQILIWATSLTLIFAVPNVIMLVKRTKLTLILLFLMVIFNVVLNFVFVPLMGIVASAYITVLSYILMAGLYIYYTKRFVQYKIFVYSFWPVVAAIISGGALWYMSGFNFIVAGIIASILYFVILFAFKFLSVEDVVFIKSIVTRADKP